MDADKPSGSAAITTIAAKVVQELAWSEPFEDAPFVRDFQGKILVSRTHWLVLVPSAKLSQEVGRTELEKWFVVLKSIKSGKPARIDVVFILEQEPGPEGKSITKLKKQTFLGAGVYLGYIAPTLDSSVLSIPDKRLKSAVLQGAKQAQEGSMVDEETYQRLKKESAQAHFALEEKLKKVSPIGTWTIFAACLLMFLWAEFFGGGTENVFTLFRFGANYPPVTLGGEWWRLIGAMFMHIGWLHLFVNLYSLLAVGCLLEKVYGNFKYLALYAVAGLGGSLASAYLGSGAISAGASGALFGLFGATALVGYRHKNEFPANFSKALSQGMLPAIIYNLIYGFSSTSIDNAAHLGGLAAGLVFALVVRPDVLTEKSSPTLVLPLALIGVLPFFVQGYVAYRAQVYDSLKNYPSAIYKDNRKLVETSLPDVFTEVTEEGESFLSGPGINVMLFSAEDAINVSVEQSSLKSNILAAFPDARFSIQEHRGFTWLVEDGLTQETARRRAFTYINNNIFKIEIYASPSNKELADEVREMAMKSVQLPGWEGQKALEELMDSQLYGRALTYLSTLEDSPENQLNEVICLVNLRHFEEALQLVEEHSANWPGSYPKDMLLAQIFAGQGEYEKALSSLEASLKGKTGSEKVDGMILRASILFKAGRVGEADAVCKQLLQSDKTDIRAKVYDLMAGQKVSTGRFEEAVTLATRSLKIEESPQALSTRGRAYLEQGLIEKAMTDLDKSFALSPNNAEANFHIARTLQQQDEMQTAQLFYERYLALAGSKGKYASQATNALSSMPTTGPKNNRP